MTQFNEKEVLKMLSSTGEERKAFEMIVNEYSETLYWKIRHIVLYHDDANDILQNTFIKAWLAIDTFQNKSKLSTWLYRIAINEALDFIRKNKKQQNIEDYTGLAEHLMSDKYFDGDEAQAMLQEAIATLPDVQRTVFTMRYYEDIKYSELSQILNTSEGALKASYHIAMKKISEYVLNHST